MNRNNFIRQFFAGAALLGTGWISKILMSQKKMPLTDANLTLLFKQSKERKNMEPFNDAIKDTPAFLRKYFTLTSQQTASISRVSKNDWKNVQSIIKQGRDSKADLDFQFGLFNPKGECARTEISLLEKSQKISDPGTKKISFQY